MRGTLPLLILNVSVASCLEVGAVTPCLQLNDTLNTDIL